MHKWFGFQFIIAVPSLPIKAGTSQFIDDSYVKHHFSDACGYNCDIELGILERSKKRKLGRLLLYVVIFVTGSYQNLNKFVCLLIYSCWQSKTPDQVQVFGWWVLQTFWCIKQQAGWYWWTMEFSTWPESL